MILKLIDAFEVAQRAHTRLSIYCLEKQRDSLNETFDVYKNYAPYQGEEFDEPRALILKKIREHNEEIRVLKRLQKSSLKNPFTLEV